MRCEHSNQRPPEDRTDCPFCGELLSDPLPAPPSADAPCGAPPVPKATARLSVAARVWCALCLAANLAVAIVGIIALSVPRTSSAASIASVIAAFAAALGFAMLLFANREGFFVVCLAALAGMAVNLMAANTLNAAFGLLHPVLTWLFIRRSWERMGQPFETPRSRRTALILASMPYTGWLGFDRFYLGYGWLGFLKAVTCGGLLVWYALDIVRLAKDTMRDGFEKPLRWRSDPPTRTRRAAGKAKSLRIWGIVLIAIGVIAAISGMIQVFSHGASSSIGSFITGPILLTGAGVLLLLKGLKRPAQK